MSEITSSTFVLAVRDFAGAIRYYTERLGFRETLRVDGWAFLNRGACNVRLGDCPEAQPISKSPDHSWFAYLHVSDAATLYAEYRSKGVEIWHALEDKPWGVREFAIVTPEGHRIVFGEPVDRAVDRSP